MVILKLKNTDNLQKILEILKDDDFSMTNEKDIHVDREDIIRTFVSPTWNILEEWDEKWDKQEEK